MQVTIRGEEKQMRVTTITLQPEAGNNMYAFHCINCGNFHQQIGGKVSKIYPIHEPSDQVPVVSMCKVCGSRYNFQTFDGYDTNKIKVILHATAEVNKFYCYQNKKKLLEYDAKVIVTLTDGVVRKPPFDVSCPDPNCTAIYFFSDLV